METLMVDFTFHAKPGSASVRSKWHRKRRQRTTQTRERVDTQAQMESFFKMADEADVSLVSNSTVLA